ncbi:MAG: pantoate--beta-alanine ligase [Phycisphaerales bacterium]|nr:pantoate--beta-alanine ligase [Phycisphaerales bacterium]
MRVIRELGEIGCGEGVLVPTMGALHEGHASLIERARRASEETSPPHGHASRRGAPGHRVTVSIFVNPTQFNDPADFQRYPRTLDADLALCERAGADAVFVPSPDAMYPRGVDVPVPALPEVAMRPGLEDAHRPGHFAGVCQVVLRLFMLLRPVAAVFGEKDWQQLQVVRAMTARQGLPVEIVPSPTVRSPGGLALSSRNSLLTPTERGTALALSRALADAGAAPDPVAAERAMRRTLAAANVRTEYAVVRDAATLGPRAPGRAGRALVAAWVGAVRLIDNSPWPWRPG